MHYCSKQYVCESGNVMNLLRHTSDDALRRVYRADDINITGLRVTGKLIFSSGCRDWKAPDRVPDAETGYRTFLNLVV